MTMIILMSTLLTMTMFMLLATNAMTMGLTILPMSLIIAMIYSVSLSSWFAFLLFLIYIGGMLVMFSYFVTMSPNTTLSYNKNHPLILISTMSMILLLLTFTGSSPPTPYPPNPHIMDLYLANNLNLLILLALILLFTLIIVVKISALSSGPLRPFSNYV